MSKAQKSSASSRRDAQNATNVADMRPGSIVRYTPEPNNLTLTKEREARLRALAELPDDQIDFSDIPEMTEEQLNNMLRNPFLYPPVRLDADVVEWFSERIGEDGSLMMAVNRVLLDHMRAEKKKAAKKAG